MAVVVVRLHREPSSSPSSSQSWSAVVGSVAVVVVASPKARTSWPSSSCHREEVVAVVVAGRRRRRRRGLAGQRRSASALTLSARWAGSLPSPRAGSVGDVHRHAVDIAVTVAMGWSRGGPRRRRNVVDRSRRRHRRVRCRHSRRPTGAVDFFHRPRRTSIASVVVDHNECIHRRRRPQSAAVGVADVVAVDVAVVERPHDRRSRSSASSTPRSATVRHGRWRHRFQRDRRRTSSVSAGLMSSLARGPQFGGEVLERSAPRPPS